MAGQTVSPPCRVETFSKLQIRVMSVACGQKHTIALTQQGVYSFLLYSNYHISSKYKQTFFSKLDLDQTQSCDFVLLLFLLGCMCAPFFKEKCTISSLVSNIICGP